MAIPSSWAIDRWQERCERWQLQVRATQRDARAAPAAFPRAAGSAGAAAGRLARAQGRSMGCRASAKAWRRRGEPIEPYIYANSDALGKNLRGMAEWASDSD